MMIPSIDVMANLMHDPAQRHHAAIELIEAFWKVLHLDSYQALVASSMRRCPICLLLVQTLHPYAGIGPPDQALVILDPSLDRDDLSTGFRFHPPALGSACLLSQVKR